MRLTFLISVGLSFWIAETVPFSSMPRTLNSCVLSTLIMNFVCSTTPMRFNQIQKYIPRATAKMLTQQLRYSLLVVACLFPFCQIVRLRQVFCRPFSSFLTFSSAFR
ncbi:winged helix-turn-helix transcriptional regulator [uncultured Mitsuokella sp.]|uniref:winged helix-turn-helix transcriptional regulator n=1 Tax=uncultured Mitsuokella sp. TaxID=453120 RepID=UPI003419B57C